MTAPDLVPVTRALISVSDKDRLIELGQALAARNVEILSTGGSAAMLRDAGIDVKEVADHTGFPEMMDGRVKTLHPKIHGGFLALRDNDDHLKAMADHDIAPIDLVVINLYPFESTVASGAGFEDCIEQIDIGGPAMVRSAAKNYRSVAIVTAVADYDDLLAELDANDGATSHDLRRKLAARAYARTANYDGAISRWFQGQLGDELPERLSLSGKRQLKLRYGENPHQNAAFYVTGENRPGVATAEQLQGKELSYNNLNDTNAAFELVAEFDPKDAPAIAIIKHANPCGVATGATLKDAYERALLCDSVSAFGGIIASNLPLDGPTAEEIAKIFTEVIIAPGADEDAKAILAKKKNLRLLVTDGLPGADQGGLAIKTLAGGFLAQSKDTASVDQMDLKVVTKRAPSDAELSDLKMAFRIVKHVKSNAIVYVRDGAAVGIGAGQMNRRDSARIAAIRAAEAAQEAGLPESLTQGSVVASDAFFPFADGLLAAAEAGATAVIQPGGSMRDDEVIAAADENDLAMVFTGFRHFNH